MIAFLFPGQGSQVVGMGQAFAQRFAESRAVFDDADRALGESLSELIFNGPADRLMLTENAQPAIVTASIAIHRALESRGCRPALVAGHSLGEYSAHVAAGTIAFADAVRVVRHRGRYMQEAVPVGAGAMAAILGLSLDSIEQACREAADGEIVSPANINALTQVVIAGAASAVARAGARARALGAKRVIPLQVSAPFHCALMLPAQDRLAPELRALAVRNPTIPVVANVDAQPKCDAASAVEALIGQVAAPVKWDAVMRRLIAQGATVFVEVGPGTVLSGLAKKAAPGATVLNVAEPDDLRSVEALS